MRGNDFTSEKNSHLLHQPHTSQMIAAGYVLLVTLSLTFLIGYAFMIQETMPHTRPYFPLYAIWFAILFPPFWALFLIWAALQSTRPVIVVSRRERERVRR